MIHNLLRYYYQNKYKIWGVIAFIVLLILVIQVVNFMVTQMNGQDSNNHISSNISTSNTLINNKETNSYITGDTSAVTGEQINTTNLENARVIIENFISACNNGNIEEAYSYLSDDCKQELYTDVNQFKTLYYDAIFGGNKKNASIENWILNTYKVDITEDIMATGNANGIKTQDYMTVVKNNDEIKLNINSFVGIEEINKEQTVENIKFTILNIKTYVDYEEYELQVENNTGNRILLDSQQNTKSIYVQDDNETEYYSYSNEILSELLSINNGFSTRLTIKFYKSYSLDNPTNNIVFSDVILNYNDNINENIERKIIEIKV